MVCVCVCVCLCLCVCDSMWENAVMCLCYVYVCVCVHGGAVSLSSYKCISVRVYAFVCVPVCFVLNITPGQCQVPVRSC